MSNGPAGHADLTRTAVIGNAAGGKSTLSRRLAEDYGLPYHQLDTLYWGPHWSVRPAELFEADHRGLVAGDKWIIDGVGRAESLALRLHRSTLIILIDLPVWQHYALAAHRHIEWLSGKRAQPVNGIPPLELMFEWIWRVDQRLMPKLRTALHQLESRGKAVRRLASLQEVNRFKPIGR